MGLDTEPRQCRRGAPHKSPNERVPCVCVYHVGQEYIGKSSGICGGILACMAFECARNQVDVIAGDGNKSCYLATPKTGEVPTYKCSLLQYWINKMMNTATQSRRKNYGRSPPVRVKHFISCNFRDLVHLSTHLDGITTENYTAELAKKTEDRGDCCMMSICEWGYARLEYEDNASYFDDQDHMDHAGEFTIQG